MLRWFFRQRQLCHSFRAAGQRQQNASPPSSPLLSCYVLYALLFVGAYVALPRY